MTDSQTGAGSSGPDVDSSVDDRDRAGPFPDRRKADEFLWVDSGGEAADGDDRSATADPPVDDDREADDSATADEPSGEDARKTTRGPLGRLRSLFGR